MHKEHIRRIPVVDKHGNLVGIITELQLLKASPSDATTLDAFEMRGMMEKVKIESLMSRQVITVSEDTPIEEAARIMAEKKIGGLPVVKDGKVVGIITETDLFKIFLELTGAHRPGLRVSVMTTDQPGELAKITKAIFEVGGNIVSLGTFMGDESDTSELTLKVDGVSQDKLLAAIKPYIKSIVDVRQTHMI
jgi:acetoin utilization protein AcuB